MKVKPNRTSLLVLMAKHDLTRKDVSLILQEEFDKGCSEAAVRSWTSRSGNDIPDDKLERLKQRVKG